MEFKEVIIDSAGKPVFQLKQERNEEECDDSNFFELPTFNDPIALIVKDEFCENYLSDVVKEEYVVSYPDNSCGNSVEFNHEFQSKDPLSAMNGDETIECPLIDNDTIFECFSCRLTFNTEVQLKKHLDRKCFRRFECGTCRRRFKCKGSFYKTAELVRDTLGCYYFVCLQCCKYFENLEDTVDHIEKYFYESNDDSELLMPLTNSESEYVNDGDVDSINIDKAYLMTHKQTHYKNNIMKKEKIQEATSIFMCSEHGCNKRFTRKDRLIVHLRIHSGDRRYHCDEDGCDKKFTEWSNLEKHRRIHVGDKRFTCDEPGCDRKFTAKCNLMEHKRTHSGENSKAEAIVCKICDKSIAYSSLRKHLKIHSGVKPYACDFEGCEKRFLRRYRLKEHSNIHTGARPYICTNADCNKKFNDKSSFKKHLQTHVNTKIKMA